MCEDSYVFFIFSTSGVEDILEVKPSSSSNMGDNEALNSTGLETFGLCASCFLNFYFRLCCYY